MNVLLCEDDEELRISVAELLELRGYHVAAVGTLRAASAAVRARAFDVALIDLDLPDGSGLVLAGEIRAAGHATRLIVTSGDEAASTRSRARDAGFERFLVKPVTERQLLAALENQTETS